MLNENVLEKQKIREKEKLYDVTRTFEKNLYKRTKGRKEKYAMMNTIVYDLNDYTYLIV